MQMFKKKLINMDPLVIWAFKELKLYSTALKVHLHEIFYFCFFPSKGPTWSPDSYPKFVSNIKANSPRYSNYSSLCVDSVNAELIFASNYIKTVNIFWLIWAPFEHFIVNFYKYYPFKGTRAAYVCLFWIDSSPSH